MTYPGGKAKTFHHVVNRIPPHRVYIEPFLGRGSVLKAKLPSDVEIGVDLDPRLTACTVLEARGVKLISGDGIEFLKRFPFEGHEVVYCDPPYIPETRRRAKVYRYDATIQDHTRLLTTLTSLNARIILSGYDNDLYRSALSQWNTHTFFAKAHDGIRWETLWFNFPEPRELHDYRYLGSTYRDRQTIKRRLIRLKQRLNGISPQERAYIREWLSTEDDAYAD